MLQTPEEENFWFLIQHICKYAQRTEEVTYGTSAPQQLLTVHPPKKASPVLSVTLGAAANSKLFEALVCATI